MIRHYSSVFHDPEAGTYGDCFRAVIASLTDARHIDDVPHFFAGGSAELGYDILDLWLTEWFGLVYLESRFPSMTLDEMLKMLAGSYPDISVMLAGQSHHGVDHVVIARNGEIIHDPSSHTGSSVLVGPTTGDFWIVGLLVSAFHK